ncbi:hypothetical protein [Aestuariivirga sp.]|uniref:hypothetical protein n=1 Tax=Aestuariivirga sp. TaxID=2650926 RepID=UPI00391C096D
MTQYQKDRFGRDYAASAPAMRAPAHRGPRRGDFIGALTDAVRDNPMSAALIGMGALWLYMGGNRTSLAGGHGKRSLIGTVSHGASDLGHGAAHAASRVGSAVSSGVSSAASGVAGTVSGAAERIGDAAGQVSDYVRGSVRGVDAESEYRNAAATREAWDTDTHTGWESGRRIRPFSLRMVQHNMQDLFERHPVAIGVAGLAIGAGLAASLPMTTRERQMLGNASETLHDKAADVVGQAKDIAGAAAEEARQHGLGGQSLKETASDFRSRTGLQ